MSTRSDCDRPIGTTALRGRDAELSAIGGRLRDAAAGRSSVILVEGRRGFGKTRLLDEACAIASSEGFSVGSGTAVQGDDAVTMAPLMAALFDGPRPVLDRRRIADGSSLTDRDWLVHRLEAPLEQAARRAPLLVCIDDLHWADGATTAALRMLPTRLGDLPIVWMVAYRSSASSPVLTDLAAGHGRSGADMLSLAPLDDSATTQIVADIVKAEPADDLLQLARCAGGNPSLVVELARGLVDDELVAVVGRRAELRSDEIPRGLSTLTRSHLSRLSALARQAATVASVLGEAISFDHVAAMLDVSPASLLGPVEELVREDVVVHAGSSLAFQSDLLRRAVIATVPPSVRQALDRQAIDVMVAAGVPPLEPAVHLATTAQVGDRAAISTLATASQALASTDPDIAAELSRRALELTAPGDPRRPALAADVALLLHDAGNAVDGKAFADAVLRDRLAPEHEAEIHMSVAQMYDLSPEVRVRAGSAALALPELTVVLRARHLSELVVSVLSSGRLEAARQLMPRAETAVAHARDAVANRAIEAAEMRLAYMEGSFTDALQQVESSLGTLRRHGDRRAREIDLLRADLLLATDDFEAAHHAALQGAAEVARDRQTSLVTAWKQFLARQLLQSGRLVEAADALGDIATSERADTFANVGDAAARVAAGRMAIHLGDGRSARVIARVAANTLDEGSPEMRRHAAWFLALHGTSCNDGSAVATGLAHLRDEMLAPGLPLLMVDVADLPQFVRIARGAGDDAVARTALEAAEDRRRRNPDVPSIAGLAADARGLVDDDRVALADAADLLADGPRPIAAASAFEDLGRALVRHGDRAAGVEALGRALQTYSHVGATWDASRVRLRLRELGVRRRLVKVARPTTGWAGLTDAEAAVVRLVAEGLTNRAIASRLYVSPHTVSMHLRHVFTKLDISSRVELTRIAFENEQAA